MPGDVRRGCRRLTPPAGIGAKNKTQLRTGLTPSAPTGPHPLPLIPLPAECRVHVRIDPLRSSATRE